MLIFQLLSALEIFDYEIFGKVFLLGFLLFARIFLIAANNAV